MMIFFGETCDISNFPFDDSLVIETYVNVEDAAGNTEIMNEREVSFDYKCEYGTPEAIGWVLEIDIGKLRSNQIAYKEYISLLNDESFCLKREFYALRDYVAMLTSKQNPKRSSNLFDLFI
ncbi:hypothetical protein SDC9_136639 [bioreactor metagenome]|uniref:Short NACHT-associated C-terminal domain-containing protein n=1 Tax=bioreactor metagenome TaxID=1076179 RepID=A0A645DJ99_9ZZZZ